MIRILILQCIEGRAIADGWRDHGKRKNGKTENRNTEDRKGNTEDRERWEKGRRKRKKSIGEIRE